MHRIAIVLAFTVACSSSHATGQDGAVVADANSRADAAPGLAFTPWILINAERGTLGQEYQGNASDQWSDADGKTLVDDTYVFEGTKSFKLHADKGTPMNGGEFGTWGAIKALPMPLHRGDVLHAQLAVYFPTTFDWTAAPWLKFFRVHTMAADGTTNEGYNDIYNYNDGTLHSIYEGAQIWASSTSTLAKGTWQVVEIEVTFDNESVDAGGMARTRLWQQQGGSMVLTMDRTDSRTLVSDTDMVDAFYLFTYWNSNNEDGMYPTQAEDCWVDRVILEYDLSKLTEHDAHGNNIIGGV